MSIVTPPEERFWQKYSPHHELSLSGAASVVVHLTALFTVALVGGLIFSGCTQSKTPVALVTTTLLGPGGSGDPAGVDRVSDEQPEIDPAPRIPTIEPLPTLPTPSPEKVTPKAVPQRPQTDPDAALRRALARGTNGPGRGGSGGPSVGDPSNPRTERMLRWNLKLSYGEAVEYLRQLHYLGAQVGFAVPGRDDRVRLVRDLTQLPAVLDEAPVVDANRIFWRDSDPAIVAAVCQVLGVVPPTPPVLFAFLPHELEDELLKKELAFGRKQKADVKESDITETVFKVDFIGPRPVIRVAELRLKK